MVQDECSFLSSLLSFNFYFSLNLMAMLPNCDKTIPRDLLGGWGRPIWVLHTFPKSPQTILHGSFLSFSHGCLNLFNPTLMILTDCISKDLLVRYSFKQNINRAPQINFCYLCSFCFLKSLNDHFHHFGRTPPWLAVAFIPLKLVTDDCYY